jgi:hypothetical protein
MENFFFTQCAAVLFDAVPTLSDVERALQGWTVVGSQKPAEGDDGWVACGPGFIVELRSGRPVIVDVVSHRWPDAPGGEDAVGRAWRSKLFGPVSSPGALARAKKQSWAWPGGAAAADGHVAMVRLRTVVDLAEDGAHQLPQDHDPIHELVTLTELAATLMRLPAATAFFLPGGEALRSREHVEAVLKRKTGLAPPAVDLWVNLRAVGLGEVAGVRWLLHDSVGMGQLRLPDQEAIFAEGAEESEAVAALLMNACLHLADGKGIPDGSTSDDGRGRRWKASTAAGLLAPTGRPVLRWTPEQSAGPTDATLSALVPPHPGALRST